MKHTSEAAPMKCKTPKELADEVIAEMDAAEAAPMGESHDDFCRRMADLVLSADNPPDFIAEPSLQADVGEIDLVRKQINLARNKVVASNARITKGLGPRDLSDMVWMLSNRAEELLAIIERQAADKERLVFDLAAAQSQRHRAETARDEARDETVALCKTKDAEIERLREALESIVELETTATGAQGFMIARSALSTAGGGK